MDNVLDLEAAVEKYEGIVLDLRGKFDFGPYSNFNHLVNNSLCVLGGWLDIIKEGKSFEEVKGVCSLRSEILKVYLSQVGKDLKFREAENFRDGFLEVPVEKPEKYLEALVEYVSSFHDS